jgi:di/tripeptidase
MKDAERLIFAAALVACTGEYLGDLAGAVKHAVKMVTKLREAATWDLLNNREAKMLTEFYEGFSDNPPAL